MKILSIGNSFSQDAQRYLSQLAKADGVDIYCVNLYIGGCPLSAHYENMVNNAESYDFEICGRAAERKISIAEAVKMEEWDVVTLQQVSHESFNYNTYTPYIEKLAEYVRENCPKAKLVLHHTWGYEAGSERLSNVGYQSFEKMSEDIEKAYKTAADNIKADGIIPSGKTMLKLFKKWLKPHRDTFHADLGYGRYAIALTWYGYLTGNDVMRNKFRDFDIPVTEKEIQIAKEAVKEALEV